MKEKPFFKKQTHTQMRGKDVLTQIQSTTLLKNHYNF